MKTIGEILNNGIVESGLYFDNNGNRMMLISEAIKALKYGIREAIKECAKEATVIGADSFWVVDEQSILKLLDQVK